MMTDATLSAARDPATAKNGAGMAASRFYARNGEVFMVSEHGGFCISHAEARRCIANWRSTDTDREPWAQRMTEQMADELESAMAQAEAQKERKAA